jgi:predicted nucleic acid-binding protein
VIVVDTNLIVYLYVETEWTTRSEQVLEIDMHWLAPFLWRSEFRNALTLYLRKNLLSFNEVLEITQEAEQRMAGNEHSVSSAQVLNLVKNSTCTAYDCEFVALAQMLNVSLVTTDKKLLREFPAIAVHPDEFITRCSS